MSKQVEEWFAVRLPSKKRKGDPKKEVGPFTHSAARSVAKLWHEEGFSVELQRRRHDEKSHTVVPKFAARKQAS